MNKISYLASPKMDEKLYEWLKLKWKYSTINKYRYLFEEWINNITPKQISGFRHNMESDYINHNK